MTLTDQTNQNLCLKLPVNIFGLRLVYLGRNTKVTSKKNNIIYVYTENYDIGQFA